MRTMIVAAAALLTLLLAAPGRADESTIRLKDGPGKDAVVQNCSACHSLDYIETNSFLDRPRWEATIKKMIGPFGAPIADTDVPAILDYLAKNYGL